MASNVVRVSVVGDATQLKRALGEADRATDTSGQKMTTFAKVAVASLAVAALGAVKQFVGDSIRAYSELEQSTGAVEAVFGDLSDVIEDFAETAADSVGLSESAFKTLAANIGGQLQNMGFAVDEAADKTIDLIKTGADLAATYGGTVSDAVSAISSLLRGERDPIEKYAISVKDADVQARNLADGLDISTPAAKKNADAISALNILMEQGVRAQGQFGDEADTIAGKQERLNARLEDQKALLGEAMAPLWREWQQLQADSIPILTDVASVLGAITSKMGEASDAAEDAADRWGLIGDLWGELTFGLGPELRDMIVEWTDAQDKSNEATAEALHPRRVLTDAQREAAIAADRGADATDDLTASTQTYIDTLRAAADPVFAAQTAIENLRTAQENLIEVQGDAEASTSDLAEAELEVAGALLEAQGAMDSLDTKTLNTAIDAIATALGKSKEEVIRLLEQLGILDGKTVTTFIDTHRRNFAPGFGGGVQEFHEGGVVGGPRGSDQLIVAKGGETVLPTHKSGVNSGAGGTVINLTINAGMGSDPSAISKAVVEALQRYQRQNGALPIRTRQ